MSTFPSQVFPANATIENLGGTTDEPTGIPYIAKGTSPASSPSVFVQVTRQLERINEILAGARELQVVSEGTLDVGVYPGSYLLGGTRKTFTGATGQTLTNNATNYVYLDASNALQVSTSSFPASVTESFPLAEVVTSGGAITSITDRRNYARNAIPTSTSSSDTGTDETSFIIDEDNASGAVDTMVRFNRGSDDAEDGAVVYDESENRIELRTQHSTGTLAPLNCSGVAISGTTALDSNGAAKVAAAVAGNGLGHSGGVLAVNTATGQGTGINSDTVAVAPSDGIALDANGVTVNLTSSGGLALSGTSPNKTLGLADGETTAKKTAALANAQGGGITSVLKATLTAGSSVAVFSSDAPYAFHVIDAWSIAKSADGGTWKVTDGTNDITDTVSVTSTDKTIDRAGTIDDARNAISASGSLSVVGDGSNADVDVYVLIHAV